MRRTEFLLMTTKFIRDGIVTACFKDGTMWSIPLSSISLIGEYTTQDGPGTDDHFVCLFDDSGNRYDIGYDDGASLLLDEIKDVIGEPLLPQLSLSTDFQSFILYPKSSNNQTLFIKPRQPRTIASRLKWLFCSGNHRLQLSDEAIALIEHFKVNPPIKVPR
jgi:hypothetical protein